MEPKLVTTFCTSTHLHFMDRLGQTVNGVIDLLDAVSNGLDLSFLETLETGQARDKDLRGLGLGHGHGECGLG